MYISFIEVLYIHKKLHCVSIHINEFSQTGFTHRTCTHIKKQNMNYAPEVPFKVPFQVPPRVTTVLTSKGIDWFLVLPISVLYTNRTMQYILF